VLDLVVEAAHKDVHSGTTADVAAGEYLTAQEVDLGVTGDLRHAFVVGRERGAHIDAKHGHLHTNKGEGHTEWKQGEDHRKVAGVSDNEQGDLHPALVDLSFAEDGLERLRVQVEALQGQRGKKQPTLAAGHHLAEAFEAAGVLLLEDDEVRLDVRVLADRVRVRVVAGVLGHPPGVADPHKEVRDHAAGRVVRLARGEHLAVGRLMGDEGVLGEEDAEDTGDDELEPAVAEEREGDPGRGHQQGDNGEVDDVESACAVKQPCFTNCGEQRREFGRGIGKPPLPGLDNAWCWRGGN